MPLTISHSKNLNLEKLFNKAICELEFFFEIQLKKPKPNLILVKDRKTIDILRKTKTPDWLVGWIFDGNVYVLCPKNYESQSNHKYSNKEYYSLIKHELTHIFTNRLCESRNGLNPEWLWEGLALYLAGQNKNKMKPKTFNNFLNFYSTKDYKIYQESGFAVQFLIEKYGKSKILQLIKSAKKIDSKTKFNKLFKRIYSFDLNYKNFK